ncbi:MAG: serine/threonine-protein kinase [Cyanobacteria bacterium J06623_7]
MSRAATSALRDGVILNNRYRIVKQIGRGGFGRAYLAEDTQRYRELCVLKEFAPQVESSEELKRAEDLFEREAGILYRLNHHQIPRFEALLKTRIDRNSFDMTSRDSDRRRSQHRDRATSLFLVQEYVTGRSYWELLQRHGKLREKEVVEMIEEILPVLDYIHSADLIHRDISPDNLILRDRDYKPVLIDFGCVKLAANEVSRSSGHSVTLIGKKGYSPDEQIRRGQTMPCSDLYALAVTALVLLTGKQPDRLYDSRESKWDWGRVDATPHLKKVLGKMLAERPCDRYQNVEQLRQALGQRNSSIATSFLTHLRTLNLAPRSRSSRNTDYRRSSLANLSQMTQRINRLITSAELKKVKSWQWGMLASVIIVIPGLISFSTINYRISRAIPFESENDKKNLALSQEELDLQRQIHRQVELLPMDSSAFYKQVDAIFHQRYPELAGKQLSETGEHQEYRQVWYQIAGNLLAQRQRQRN